MLSYSTLGSGKGPDVDLVEEATTIVKDKAPDLAVVGSIQFDAAWFDRGRDQSQGRSGGGPCQCVRIPGSVRGQHRIQGGTAFPGAAAVGLVLQGLNRPVNDLSRGATVQDIINTIALTAIEAQ